MAVRDLRDLRDFSTVPAGALTIFGIDGNSSVPKTDSGKISQVSQVSHRIGACRAHAGRMLT